MRPASRMMMAHLEGALRFEERVGVTSYDIKGLSGVGLPRHRRIRGYYRNQVVKNVPSAQNASLAAEPPVLR